MTGEWHPAEASIQHYGHSTPSEAAPTRTFIMPGEVTLGLLCLGPVLQVHCDDRCQAGL